MHWGGIPGGVCARTRRTSFFVWFQRERATINSRHISYITGPGKDLNGYRFSWNSSKETPVVIFKNPEALKTLVK